MLHSGGYLTAHLLIMQSSADSYRYQINTYSNLLHAIRESIIIACNNIIIPPKTTRLLTAVISVRVAASIEIENANRRNRKRASEQYVLTYAY